MKYTKHPIDLPQQLENLKQRGLAIANEEIALEQLRSISYFRLANYWNTMESQTDKHQFLPNSNFENIIKTYIFDKRLRTLVFTSIQDIEIALRTRIIQFCYLAYLEQSINPNSSLKKEIPSLLRDIPKQKLKAMGFPDNWQSEPLWTDI